MPLSAYPLQTPVIAMALLCIVLVILAVVTAGAVRAFFTGSSVFIAAVLVGLAAFYFLHML